KYDFAKCYSRRIDKEHRIVFYINGNDLVIVSCRTHYKK
ncbi:MAG: type II toxin-antitoxin system YoeB family toxin, partial [Lachnospiraceae bacterium]|nr:type II toxin-antitoxin system YoeB family toxin [Lachnospiraceae bacterium]